MSREQYKVYAGGRIVGEVTEDGRFLKRVRGSLHMLREPKGWALDSQSLKDAQELGATTVELHDTEAGITYSATIERICLKGFDFDRGHGPQVCLPLKFWTVERPGEARQLSLTLGGAA